MTASGNHERAAGQGFEQYDRRLPMPTGDEGRWYAVQVGSVLLVGLNSETACEGPPPIPSQEMTTGRSCEGASDPEPDQLAFLEDTLARAADDPSIDWRIVFFHHSPWSSSSAHGSIEPLQDFWGPVFQEGGVDLVVNGHDHTYQRTWPMLDQAPAERGVVHVVAGMGGDSLYSFDNDRPDWLAYRDNDHWGLFAVNVSGDRLEGRYVTLDGTVRDRFVLENAPGGNARVVVNGTGEPRVPGTEADGSEANPDEAPAPSAWAALLGLLAAGALARRR